MNSGALDDDALDDCYDHNNDNDNNTMSVTKSAYETEKDAAAARVALQPAVTEDELNQRLQVIVIIIICRNNNRHNDIISG